MLMVLTNVHAAVLNVYICQCCFILQNKQLSCLKVRM